MAYRQVMGQFKERGDESVKHLASVTEFAQNHIIHSIMRVGTSSSNLVSVVAYTNLNSDGTVVDISEEPKMMMVKHGLYDMMDFTSDYDLKAYNNMNETVIRDLGIYSNIFEVGVGYMHRN